MPPHGNIAPQPPVPSALPSLVAPAVIVPAISAPGPHAATTPAQSAGLTAAAAAIGGLPAQAQGLAAAGTAAASRTVADTAAVRADAAAARADAAAARAAADLNASPDTANSGADATGAAGSPAAAAAPVLPDSGTAEAAAAAAAERLAAVPDSGPGPQAKSPASLAPAGGNAPGSTAAASDAPSAAGPAVPASAIPVLAQQNSGGADKHAHDGASSTPGGNSIDATASMVAGEAGVRGLGTVQGAASAMGTPPPPDLHSPQFPDQIAAHVSYLVDQNLNGATLQVNPPQLGPIELRVSVDAGHAQVWMSAHSAATCDALQQSSSKLRDMLASQGFGQVSVDVSQRSFQDRSASAQTYVWPGADEPAAAAPGAAAIQPWSARVPTGVLDAYA